MLFSSIVFLLIALPIAFVGYYLLAFSALAQNIWLFAVSVLFYAWGEPVYVGLLLLSTVVNWAAGLLLEKCRGKRHCQKGIFILICLCNIGLLAGFKYIGFLVDMIHMAIGRTILPEVSLPLPIGISFYTLLAISYVTDIYRNEIAAEKNPLYAGLYMTLFWKLPAGPLMRYDAFQEQLKHRKTTFRKLGVGSCRLIMGLAKKVLLADNLALLANQVFQWSEMGAAQYHVSAGMAWTGLLAYTLQIYFDFSGYSDMAIGLGLLFGFKFEENFAYPYAATSMRDFWKRWHISLGKWFSQYVYFPLGGSHVENKDKMVRNLLLVWLLLGIWHGAAWNFLFWGMWHFLFQLAERFLGYTEENPHRILLHLYTLFVVSMGWVIFRANDLYQARIYFQNLFMLNHNLLWSDMTGFLWKEYAVFLLAGVFCALPFAQKCNTWLVAEGGRGKKLVLSIFYPIGICGLFFLSLLYLARNGSNPFLYFHF